MTAAASEFANARQRFGRYNVQPPVALVAGIAGTVILVLVVLDARRASRYWHLSSSTEHHAIILRIGVKAASAFVYICVSVANIVTINWLEWVFLILAAILAVVSSFGSLGIYRPGNRREMR